MPTFLTGMGSGLAQQGAEKYLDPSSGTEPDGGGAL